jgi:hypothetical protein
MSSNINLLIYHMPDVFKFPTRKSIYLNSPSVNVVWDVEQKMYMQVCVHSFVPYDENEVYMKNHKSGYSHNCMTIS